MFNAQSIVVLRERLKVSSVCYEVITFSILHNILPGPLPGVALKAVKCSRKMELAFSVVLGDFPHSQSAQAPGVSCTPSHFSHSRRFTQSRPGSTPDRQTVTSNSASCSLAWTVIRLLLQAFVVGLGHF